jgi:hypothetical protein
MGVLPLLSKDDLEKGAWGLALSTVSMIIYREVIN